MDPSWTRRQRVIESRRGRLRTCPHAPEATALSGSGRPNPQVPRPVQGQRQNRGSGTQGSKSKDTRAGTAPGAAESAVGPGARCRDVDSNREGCGEARGCRGRGHARPRSVSTHGTHGHPGSPEGGAGRTRCCRHSGRAPGPRLQRQEGKGPARRRGCFPARSARSGASPEFWSIYSSEDTGD